MIGNFLLWIALIASGVAGAEPASGLHLLDFEGGSVGAVQATGYYSFTGWVAYTPEWVFGASGFGLKFKAGVAPHKANSSSLFAACDASAWLTFRPGLWVDGLDAASAWRWSLDVGGGVDYWWVSPFLVFPAVGAQLGLHFNSRFFWIFERLVFGYRLGLFPGVTTHVGYAGLGISFF